MIFKEGWLSDQEILEIYGQVNREERIQRELPKRIEIQNIENQITTETRNIIINTRREDKCRINEKPLNEQKTTLPSLWNRDKKKSS